MRLEEVHLQQAPGLDAPLQLDGLGADVVLIHGPNASGKSRLVRSLVRMLMPGHGHERDRYPLVASSRWHAPGGGTIEVRAMPGVTTTSRDGRELPGGIAERLGPADHPWYAITIDDLARWGGGDLTEQRVLAELAGGLDIAAAVQDVEAAHVPRLVARRRELERHRARLRELEQADRDLLSQRSRLDRLRDDVRRAEHDRERLALLDGALELVEARTRQAVLQQERTALPAGVSAVREDDLASVDRLLERVESLRSEQQRAGQDAAAAEEALAATGLDSPLAEPLTRELAAAAVALEAAIATEEAAARELASATARQDAALAALPTDGEQGASPDARWLGNFEQAARRLHVARWEHAELEARRKELEVRRSGFGDLPPTAGRERASVLATRQLGGVDLPSRLPGTIRWLLPVALGAVLATAAPAILGELSLAWLLPSVVGVVALGLLAIQLRQGAAPAAEVSSDAAELRAAAHALGVTGLPDGPREAARVLEEQLDRWRRQELEAHAIERELDTLARRRGELDVVRAAAAEECAALLARVGIAARDDLAESMELLELARRVSDLAVARQQRAAATGAHDAAAQALALARQRLEGLLEQAGAPTGHADGVGLVAAAHGIAEAAGRAREAAAGLRRVRAEHGRLGGQLADATTELSAAWERCGLVEGDREGLRRLVSLIPDRDRLDGELAILAARIEDLEARLPAALREPGLAVAAIHAEQEQLRRHVDRLDEAHREIGAIEDRLEEASRSSELASVRALEQQALEQLEAAEASERLGEVVRGLGQWLSVRSVDTARTRAAEAAAALLLAMSEGRLELTVSTTSVPATLAVRDHHAGGRVQPLAELSTAQRLQVLIATRLGYLETLEAGGPPLPVLLDESLTNFDPDNLRRAARAIAIAAGKQDRQVIYLAAQPRDAHDLAAAIEALPERGTTRIVCLLDGSVEQPLPAVPTTDSLPTPEPGESLDAWLGRVEQDHGPVGRMAPWAKASAQPAWALVADDLDRCHALLAAHVVTVGQLQRLLDAGLPAGLDASAAREAMVRSRALEAFLRVVQDGRAAPIGRGELRDVLEVATGMTPERWLDSLGDLLEAPGIEGSARRMVEALASPPGLPDEVRALLPRGFGPAMRASLEEALGDGGHLPVGTPGTRADAIARARAAHGGDGPPDSLLDAWWALATAAAAD